MTKYNFEKRTAEIAKRVKALRFKAGFKSYETFAYKNGLPRVQYWRMEKGTNFTIKGLLKILDIHKISLSDFFEGME